MSLEIEHDTRAHRFEVTVEGEPCRLDYHLDGERMTITHTWVPGAVGGRGIASELVAAAFAAAERAGWKVRTQCSYTAAWAQRHPEVAARLA